MSSPYHDAILDKRARGLTAQRIWQDLTEQFGYHRDALMIVHARVPAGQYAPMPGQRTPETTTRQQAFVAQLLGRCERVGPPLHQWAEAALAERGVRA